MNRIVAFVLVVMLGAAACTSIPPDGGDLSSPGRDAAGGVMGVVINEVFPHGADELTDPDWAELKNIGDSEVDLSGYKVRDDKISGELPAGTRLQPGAYLIIYCDDVSDGAVMSAIYVFFKLGGSDELH